VEERRGEVETGTEVRRGEVETGTEVRRGQVEIGTEERRGQVVTRGATWKGVARQPARSGIERNLDLAPVSR
jgi:hypothetical protein